MKLKSKKSALLLSFTSLLLCFAMLAGSTFAWFTDTATTGVNKIVSGNLKVDIVGADSDSHISTLNFTKATGAEREQLLWEPGCRYLTEGFRIANKGNLALKWKAEINKDNIKNGKADSEETPSKSLLDVIDFYVVKSKDENAEAVKVEEFVGNLTKGAKSDVYYIKGVMQTTAGNDYQNLTLDGITITVYATQYTVENDSFNNQYDKDATYLTYPAGVTDAIFDSKTDADYSIPGGSTGKAQAVAAYVDNNGEVQYTADIKTALDNGASTIYLKKDTKGRLMALTDFLAQPNFGCHQGHHHLC